MGNTSDTFDSSDTSDTDTSDTFVTRTLSDHYTTEEGQEGILKSGVIYDSDESGANDDAVYENGVSHTSIPTCGGRVDIALYIYDGSENNWENKIDDEKKITIIISVSQVKEMGNTSDTSDTDTSDTSDTDTSDTSDTVKLYHYTTKEGQEGIRKSGVIYESDESGAKDDAVYGNGVYLTSIPPSKGKANIALNNYDGSDNNWENKIDDGHVDNYVAVELKRDDVEEVANDRDVYVYHGDLHLDDAIDVSYGKVENNREKVEKKSRKSSSVD